MVTFGLASAWLRIRSIIAGTRSGSKASFHLDHANLLKRPVPLRLLFHQPVPMVCSCPERKRATQAAAAASICCGVCARLRQAAAVCLEGGECVVSGFSCAGRRALAGLLLVCRILSLSRLLCRCICTVHSVAPQVCGPSDRTRLDQIRQSRSCPSWSSGVCMLWQLSDMAGMPLDRHTCACHTGSRTSPPWQPRLPPTPPH